MYHSAQGTGTACVGAPIVVHGQHAGMIIQGNRIEQDLGMAQGSCWGISVTPAHPEPEWFKQFVIADNLIANVGNVSIQVASCQGCVIENNVIVQGQTGFDSTGIMAHYNGTPDPADLPLDAVQVLNNTIYLASDGQNTGIVVGLQGSNHVIAGNVILGAAKTKPFSCFGYDLAPSAYDADHNLCWNSAAAISHWEMAAGPLAAWQTSTGLDMHSLSADPKFVASALTGYDFTPAAGSPLLGAGDPKHAPADDFTGKARSSPPDIGAIQR